MPLKDPALRAGPSNSGTHKANGVLPNRGTPLPLSDPKPSRLHLDRRAAKLVAEAPAALPEKELLTPGEVCAFIGCAPFTLKNWARHKAGPPRIKISKKMCRYNRLDLLRWLESRTQAGNK